jgi:hypothetical protein
MLPGSIQVPAAVVLLTGGAVACFAGYRLFKLVLGIYGFILGALIGSSMMAANNTWALVAGALGGGAIGALVLLAGYFFAVALVGAGVGALVANLAWKPIGGDPHWAAVVVCAALGALAAMKFQRHVIIAATSLAGGWTMLVGAAALVLKSSSRAASAGGDVWMVYPNTPPAGSTWIYVAWVALSLVGMYVQLHSSGVKKNKARK